MPNAVRRVGGTGVGRQTYTLGPQESFRLDALSYQIGVQPWGSDATPTVIVESASGQTIAAMAAESWPVTNLIGSLSFDYTGPAVMVDDYEFDLPLGYMGYLLHDFGAGITTSALTANWQQPPGLFGAASVTWLRSPGAVNYGPGVGGAVAYSTDSITLTLTAPVAAGHYLLLQLAIVQDDELLPDVTAQPTVTGSVAGNVLDFSGHATFGFSVASAPTPSGLWINTASEFLRVVNPLGIGDTITLRLNHGAQPFMQVRAHDVTGLTVGNPIGPNPGGNFIGVGIGAASPPLVMGQLPFLAKWTGAALINDCAATGPSPTFDVMLAHGLSWYFAPNTALEPAGHVYTQLPIPTLDLGPQDSITVECREADGTLRIGDTVHDFLVWGVDE